MASLTGVKYILSREDELNVSGYEFYKQVGEIYIYRNTDTENIAKFYTKTVSEETYEAAEALDNWMLLKEVLITSEETGYEISNEEVSEYKRKRIYLFDEEKMDKTVCTPTDDGLIADNQHFINLPIDQKELSKYESARVELTIETDSGTELEFRMNDDRANVTYQYAGSHRYVFSIPEGTKEIQIQITNSNVHFVISKMKFFGTEEDTEFSDSAQISLNAPEKDTYITGTIRTQEDGMVMLAIPFEDGWTVKLNGEEQTTVAADYGFIAFEVKAGDYDLEITYTAPMFREGCMISLVSWALFVLLWVWNIRKKQVLMKKEG